MLRNRMPNENINHNCLYLGHDWGQIITTFHSYGMFGMDYTVKFWQGQKCNNCEEFLTELEYNTERENNVKSS